MRIFVLLGCSAPVWGTWLFTLAVTPDTGDECDASVFHNVTDAWAPSDTGGDTGWSSDQEDEVSAELFFGRLESAGAGEGSLVVGTELLPGERQPDGVWVFWWENRTAGHDTSSHVSGYVYDLVYELTSTLRLVGAFEADTFAGSWETESAATQTWSESDTWSAEAATLVGDHGDAPLGTYLVAVGDTGAVEPASNAREAAECGDGTDLCTLAVSETCARRYDVTGVVTDFEPEDAGWTEDAGQPAGI